MKRISIALLLAALLAGSVSAASVTPLQLGLWGTAAQLFPAQTEVIGLRLNLLKSSNDNVTGIDFGFSSESARMQAVQFNLVNRVDDEFTGIGVGLYNQTCAATGIQFGLVNTVVNDLRGFQIGLFNSADQVAGIQFGLINHTVSMRGLQIGIVNVIEDGPVGFFPVLNAAF